MKRLLQDAARNAHVGRVTEHGGPTATEDWEEIGGLICSSSKKMESEDTQHDVFKAGDGVDLIIGDTTISTEFDDYECLSFDRSPQQDNGYDCGIFTALNAFCLATNGFDVTKLRYDQNTITSMKYRERLANFLLSLNNCK